MQDLPSSYITPPKRGMGCFMKGCVFIAVLLALIFMVVCGGCVYVQHNLGSFLTDHQIAVRPNTTTNEQYQVAMRKLQPLAGMEAPGQPPATAIDLTADDLNAMIGHDPHLADAQGKCFFTLPGDQFAVDLSSEIPGVSSQGKIYYINARVIGDLEIAGGAVRVVPHKIESFEGKELPPWIQRNSVFQAGIDDANRKINDYIHNSSDLADMVAKVSSAKVQNGHLVLALNPTAADTPVRGGSPVAAPTP